MPTGSPSHRAQALGADGFSPPTTSPEGGIWGQFSLEAWKRSRALRFQSRVSAGPEKGQMPESVLLEGGGPQCPLGRCSPSVDSLVLSGVGKGVDLKYNVISRVKSAFLYPPVEGSKNLGLQAGVSLPRKCECRSVNSWWATPASWGLSGVLSLRAQSC